MKRVVVTGPGQITVEEVEPPGASGPGEVSLQLHTVGICGGDIALLAGRNPLVSYPVVPGHECVATVADDRHPSFAEGSAVVVYPTFACGDRRACRACREDRPNHCPRMTVLGLSRPAGCLVERFVLPANQCIPIPTELGARVGALLEPLAVAAHVTARSGVRPGDSVLVLGSGAIGIATGLTARALGAERVLFADIRPGRSAVLARLGFADFSTRTDAELVEWVRDTAGGVDVVYDTVTISSTAAVASRVLERGGRYCAVAAAKAGQRLELDYQSFYQRELSLIGCRNYTPVDFETAIARVHSGQIDPVALRTGVFGLTAAEHAFAELTGRPEENVKVLLTRDELLGSTPLLSSGAGR